MKSLKRISAMVMSSVLALSAMPLTAVSAEDTPAAEEVKTQIVFDGTKITGSGEGVTVEGSKVTITHSGSYEFSGTLDDGQIVVNIPDEKADAETVKLYFKGMKLTGKTAAPVYVINAENTSINLVENTENFLADGAFYDETATGTSAVIYAKDDITIKGEGSLRVDAAYNYGMFCNNDIKITGGTLKFKVEGTPADTSATAEKRGDAIRAKKSVTVKGGKTDINAEGDGLKSTKGDVIFSDGEAEIKAGNDAVQAETSLQIAGGKLKANGDRGLTCQNGKISISGGSVCATATDNNPANVEATQTVVMFHLTEEVPKDNVISLEQRSASSAVMTTPEGGTATGYASSQTGILNFNPDKKFSYLLLSDAEIKSGEKYYLSIGEKDAKIGDADSFTVAETISSFDNVKPDLAAAAVTFKKGDVNGDQNVTISDAVLLARITAEDATLVLTNGETDRADVDGSGLIDADDLTLLLRTLAGLVKE
ncbi:MAG: carbohydrate-binding domain-containing protein [Oscillospiraceae bacterium]|nr:carbohydrate-binding domain-containing protein [Oscillospiraceae bacterium]